MISRTSVFKRVTSICVPQRTNHTDFQADRKLGIEVKEEKETNNNEIEKYGNDWKPWLSNPIPRNFWNDIYNQRRYMDWLGNQLEVTSLEDWYKQSLRIIEVMHSSRRLLKCIRIDLT